MNEATAKAPKRLKKATKEVSIADLLKPVKWMEDAEDIRRWTALTNRRFEQFLYKNESGEYGKVWGVDGTSAVLIYDRALKRRFTIEFEQVRVARSQKETGDAAQAFYKTRTAEI